MNAEISLGTAKYNDILDVSKFYIIANGSDVAGEAAPDFASYCN